MSRIGHAHINIPAAATVEFKDNVVTVKGSNITMTRELKEGFDVTIEDGVLTVVRPNDSKDNKALHGLYRSLINNMITGVTEGFKKQLELVGVGYRASNNGQKLDLSLGFSHNIVIELPTEIKVETLTEKGKNPIITLSSHDNQLLGMIVAKIRSYRKPEPYKGKGIKYVGEIIRRKAGKSA
ncbi:50S ribosomal protein L6 [Empedobacter falsenii]|uniref:Large ribosomal subunit protein uL6 n=1 Tax=Empedobacter falsenii TaxID=343874 RepID=A0A7H9DPL7_9FLAO|nr:MULTISPECIES: 50S ribosomal protein L6 [Empedobacter]HCC92913.1 50S ribosomal protein L6 [Flavobacteriaceae bacterium]MDH2206426.1 50S ribosomal protein L6 [Empedobacter sp. GD03644]MDM1062175.1 50S ribosomal protein L6 [Empedobacter falsenii]MDM1299693.1 50S ribosomal protein L6 [Empedobacter falsenii]MDM1319486.1 50S ribosomal protein L6 [Empedobacter falsenii]